AAHGNLKVNGPGRMIQPVDVLLEAEDPAGVRPDPLEDAVAIEQAVVEHADLGVALLVKLATDINLRAHARPSRRCAQPMPRARQRPGDRRPLHLAAGKLGGKMGQPVLKSHALEQFTSLAPNSPALFPV